MPFIFDLFVKNVTVNRGLVPKVECNRYLCKAASNELARDKFYYEDKSQYASMYLLVVLSML
jgi:hypothetical protein